MMDLRTKRSTVVVSAAAVVSGMLALGPVHSNPTGAQVVTGDVTINAAGGRMTVNSGNSAIINWQSFSVGAGEAVRFNQADQASRVLNRVTGGTLSQILGQLDSNGQVYLINPNGVVVGAGATINTAGLVMSSLNLSDENFLAGVNSFSGGGNGTVVNRGLIKTTSGGDVLLIAPGVENHGVISTQGGNLILAAGKSVELASLDVDHVRFTVSAGDGEVLNLGQLVADGGAAGLFASRIASTGSIQARGVSQDADGSIRLVGSDSVSLSGRLDASGVNGGSIDVTGDNITVASLNATVNGAANGGRMRIGGDFQGKGSMPHATRVTIDSASRLSADAGQRGNGGTIIVWSDKYTAAHGTLTARGGAASGDGGLVETSSAGKLEFSTPVDVSAANGKAGTWLLDPEDIIIDEAGAASISTSLNGGSNVTIKTADEGDGEGNIAVNAGIAKTEGPDASLTLDAHGTIDVNAPITSTEGSLDVNLVAGRKVNVSADINTNGGSFNTNVTAPEVPESTDPVVDPAEPEVPAEPVTPEEPATLVGDDREGGKPEEVKEEMSEAADETVNAVTVSVDMEGETPAANPISDIVVAANVDTAGGDIAIVGEHVEIVSGTGAEAGDVLISTDGGSLTVDAGSDVIIASDGDADIRIQTGGDVDIIANSVTVASSADGGDVIIETGGELSALTTGDVIIEGGQSGDAVVDIQAGTISLSADQVKVSNVGSETGNTTVSATNDVTVEGDSLVLEGPEGDVLVSTDEGKVNVSGVNSCEGCDSHVSGTLEAPMDDVDTRDDPNASGGNDDPVTGGGTDPNVVASDDADKPVLPADVEVTETVDELTGNNQQIVVSLLDNQGDDRDEDDAEKVAEKEAEKSSAKSSSSTASKRALQCH